MDRAADRETDCLLSILANAEYEIDDIVLSALGPLYPWLSTLLASEQHDPAFVQEAMVFSMQQIAELARGLISLPMVQEAMILATQSEWEQARDDYLTIGACARMFAQVCARVVPFPHVPEGFQYNALAKCALLAIPLGISSRRNGYGHWIDVALAKIREFMDDPEFQERLPTIDTWGEQIFQDAEAHYRLAH